MAEAAACKAAAKAKAKKDKSDSLRNRLLADMKCPRSLRRVPQPRRLCATSRARVILDIINKNNTIKLNKIKLPELSTQVQAYTTSTQTREGQRSETQTFLSVKHDTEHIYESMTSNRGGERQTGRVIATMRNDAPEQRVIGAKLEDDVPAEKTEDEKTIEEMVRRMEREIDKEFKDFALDNVVGDSILTTAAIPAKVATATAAETATAAAAKTATAITASEDATTAAVAASMTRGAVEGAAVKSLAVATRVSKTEHTPPRVTTKNSNSTITITATRNPKWIRRSIRRGIN